MNTLQVRSLTYLGPNCEPASITFGPGLNVIYGASNTGKSFIVDSIDFMLGGKGPLRDIPQREPYDRILLGIETSAGEKFTVYRSTSGGPFKVFEGIYISMPEGEGLPLAEQHNDKRDDNLSRFLLDKMGLAASRIRKNMKGRTQSLSFRNLARLIIINEEEIIQQRSPLSDGNYTADTANTSVFKFLLTGVDDSSLGEENVSSQEEQSKEAQLELLDQLIGDFKKRISNLSLSKKDLIDQEQRLSSSIDFHGVQLSQSEYEFKEISGERRLLLRKLEIGNNRFSEVMMLLERFELLKRHYDSDVERLRGIEEAGILFSAFPEADCPLCGASPVEHRVHENCEWNPVLVVEAAQAELSKISRLQDELAETIVGLQKEKIRLEARLPKLNAQNAILSEKIDAIISPNLREMRTQYRDLVEKRGDVNEALGLYRTIQDLQKRKIDLEGADVSSDKSNMGDIDLSSSTVDKFSGVVLNILTKWGFPDAQRVHFDLKAKDLVINGVNRISFGKGLRAITQSAFTIGLLEYCRVHSTPHPGFALLDSPLLSYREPENDADDLRKTDLNAKFFDHLEGMPKQYQVIIIENTDPPVEVEETEQFIRFTGNSTGRYGFFPITKNG